MDTTIVSIRDRLLKEREALLDLSTRNRLLNTPLRTRNVRTIEIVDEKPAEVFRILADGRKMTFLPGTQLSEEDRRLLEEGDKETGGIPQPAEDQDVDRRGVAARHTDLRLQTRLTSEGLQKRLFDIWYDARTLEEEQGVNILYLAIGLLRWYEDDNSDVARHAPLVLLPVSLERSSAAERFHLKGRGEPPSPNITLQAKLKIEFGIVIEDFDNEDDLNLPEYIAKIAETVSGKSRWEVLPDSMVLGFYSFAKFLMYRDLDPDNWPEGVAIGNHALITGLLRDGFPESDPLIAGNESIDAAIPPSELNHVVDADSSQAVAIAEAVAGRTIVVKGPPGTGKSQTITNIIAAAAAKGRKVLFVSEKMAALEVVHRRLKECGLGPLALELHSNKINKRTVLEELKRTKEAGNPAVQSELTVVQKLGDVREELTAYANRLHEKFRPCGLTPYQIMGRLIASGERTDKTVYPLTGAEKWTQQEFEQRLDLVDDIASRLREMGVPTAHPWRGVSCDPLDPMEREELLGIISKLAVSLTAAVDAASTAVSVLEAPALERFSDLLIADRYLLAVKSFPSNVELTILTHDAWVNRLDDLARLVNRGRAYSSARRSIEGRLNVAGWSANFSQIRTSIVTKGASLFRLFDGAYRKNIKLFRSYIDGDLPKRAPERLKLVDEIMAAQNAKRAFENISDVSQAFGSLWKSEFSDWEVLQSVLNWRQANNGLPNDSFSRIAVSDRICMQRAAELLTSQLKLIQALLRDLQSRLVLDCARTFGQPDIQSVELVRLKDRFEQWLTKSESLSRYIAFSARVRKLRDLGGGSISDAVFDGQLDAAALQTVFDNSIRQS